jgi:hypothetical protein
MREETKNLIFSVMKNRKLKIIIATALAVAASCNEPKTVVTDIIHTDGSVTRRIEIKNEENNFKTSNIQVPFDNTWTVQDSVEINENGDTVWVKRAEKLFRNVDEINRDYDADSSYNKEISRKAGFNKKFRWFHTGYRFSETIDKKMSYGYPVSDFLNPGELAWFYSPYNVNDAKKNGPDSLKYKALSDTVEKKTDWWWAKSIVSEWIGGFTKLTTGKTGKELSLESLKAREDEFVRSLEANDKKFDSLWANGVILKEFIGEANALKYKAEADSSMNMVMKDVFVNFRDYTLRMVMPGKVIGTNGFIDSTNVLNWPVQSNYFLTQPYEMWAESKVPNRWAWILSGLFLLFVVTGIIIKQKGKG